MGHKKHLVAPYYYNNQLGWIVVAFFDDQPDEKTEQTDENTLFQSFIANLIGDKTNLFTG